MLRSLVLPCTARAIKSMLGSLAVTNGSGHEPFIGSPTTPLYAMFRATSG